MRGFLYSSQARGQCLEMRLANHITKAKNSRAFFCLWCTRGVEALCGFRLFLIYICTRSYANSFQNTSSHFTFMWPCIVTNFFVIKPTDALISQIYFVKKLYMFRAVPPPIIRSFLLYIRHWYMSSNLHDIYQCRMYSGKILMMGGGTARNL